MSVFNKICKSCSKDAKVHVVCFKCGAIYHTQCLLPGLMNENGYIACCSNITSQSTDGPSNVGNITVSTNLDNSQEYVEVKQLQEKQELLATKPLENPNIKEENIDEDEIKVCEELAVYYDVSNAKDTRDDTTNFLQPGVEEVMESAYSCVQCCLEFSEEKCLNNHNRVCPYQGKDMDQLNNSGGKVICNFCNVGILDMKYYEKHVMKCRREHSRMYEQQNVADANKKKLKCGECNFSTDRNSHLLNHILIHNDEKQFKCSICEKSFKQRGWLTAHIKIHDKEMEKKFMCVHCNTSFYSESSLIYHINSKHMNDRRYKCSDCLYTTSCKDSLTEHILVKHSDDVNEYKCDQCEYSTHRKINLVRHIRNHASEKPFKCSYENCSYSSIQSTHLKRHIKACHTHEKGFKCDQCSYECIQKYVLNNHIKKKHN